MDEPHSDPRITFSRHRRNLLAVSLVLLGFQWAGATISRIDILGNTIDLSAPLDITTPLWIAWAYFSLRAYQYYREIPGSPISERFADRVHVVAGLIAERIAKRDLRKTINPSLIKPGPVKLELSERSIVGYEDTHWLFELRGTASVDETKGGTRGTMQVLAPYSVRMPTSYLYECRIRAAGWLAINTPVVSEYLLPLAVALLPVIKWAYAWVRHIAT